MTDIFAPSLVALWHLSVEAWQLWISFDMKMLAADHWVSIPHLWKMFGCQMYPFVQAIIVNVSALQVQGEDMIVFAMRFWSAVCSVTYARVRMAATLA
jgi:hypothetical protein